MTARMMNIRGQFIVPHIRRGEVEWSGQRRGVILMRRWKKI